MKDVLKQELTAITGPDKMLLNGWLHNRPANTALSYRADAASFLAFCGKPVADVKLADLQAWADSMGGLSQATRARRISAVKSMLSYAVTVELIPSNPGAALRVKKPEITTAERILTTVDVKRMLGAETDPRLHALLNLLYVVGLRASEACDLRWRDMTGNGKKDGEARILGKGAKLRTVGIPLDLWKELSALSQNGKPDAPVIPGRGGGVMDRAAVHRAVKRAARRGGVNPAASAHWLRHSHASHSLDNGCKPHVLQASMGHSSLATTSRYTHVRAGEGSSSFIK